MAAPQTRHRTNALQPIAPLCWRFVWRVYSKYVTFAISLGGRELPVIRNSMLPRRSSNPRFHRTWMHQADVRLPELAKIQLPEPDQIEAVPARHGVGTARLLTKEN